MWLCHPPYRPDIMMHRLSFTKSYSFPQSVRRLEYEAFCFISTAQNERPAAAGADNAEDGGVERQGLII